MRATILQAIDHLVLKGLNHQIQDSFADSYPQAEPLPYYIDACEVYFGVEQGQLIDLLTMPGVHQVPVTLETPLGLVSSQLKVIPAAEPDAPLVLCHHGLGQRPMDFVARHMVEKPIGRSAHIVSIQAPYHFGLRDPFSIGFSTVAHLNQMMAGSVAIMAAVEAALTPQSIMVVGLSLGGIVGLLYQGHYGSAQAVVPVCASPDLAQVLIDQITRFRRDVQVSQELIRERLDFTAACLPASRKEVFPILADLDLFFRYDHHRGVYGDRPVLTLKNQTHITAPRNHRPIHNHIRKVFDAACFPHNRSGPMDQRTIKNGLEST